MLRGHEAAPIIADNALFVINAVPKRRQAIALGANSGKMLWRAYWLSPPNVRGTFSDAARKRRSTASRLA